MCWFLFVRMLLGRRGVDCLFGGFRGCGSEYRIKRVFFIFDFCLVCEYLCVGRLVNY